MTERASELKTNVFEKWNNTKYIFTSARLKNVLTGTDYSFCCEIHDRFSGYKNIPSKQGKSFQKAATRIV
jgi:hypothetical protein